MTAGDLGLSATTRARLAAEFPWCQWVEFEFSAHPPHVAQLENYAWKPLLIDQVFQAGESDVLWLDSASLIHGSLEPVRVQLASSGFYTLCNQATIRECTDARVLATLDVAPAAQDAAMLAGGVVGFSRTSAVAQAALGEWKKFALRPEAVAPPPPRHRRHRFDQSLLSIILQRRALAGELQLTPQAIDVSAANPVRWVSSRNKIPASFPTWLDPLARAGYRARKAADRQVIRFRTFRNTRLAGLHRWTKEAFRVCLAPAAFPDCPRGVAPGAWAYLADPFLHEHADRVWLFAEQFLYSENRGRLVVVALDPSGAPLAPEPLTLHGVAPGHRSFPRVFSHGGKTWLLPESSANGTVDLFVCESFPLSWRIHRRLLAGIDAADPTLVPHGGRWWLFVSVRTEETHPRHLEIYYADAPDAAVWTPHPVNSRRLYADAPAGTGRNAGALLHDADGFLVRPIQSSQRRYGEGIAFRRLTQLTTAAFTEEPCEPPPVFAGLCAGHSPHHVSTAGGRLAWDLRVR